MRAPPALLRRAAAWLVATMLLVLCFRQVEWSRVLVEARSLRPGWLVAAVCANLLIVLAWAVQWVLFLPRRRSVPLARMLGITSVMAMVSNSVPFMAGQLTGLHLLARRGGVGHAAALSVTTLDQLAEGLAKVTLLALLAVVIPLPEPLRAALVTLPLAVGALLALTLAGAFRHGALAAFAERLGSGAASRAGRFAARWARQLAAVRRPRVLPLGYLLALGMKVAEAAGIVAVQVALGVRVPVWVTLLVLAAVSIATMVSVAPANLGVYESSAFVAYRWAGVDADTALTLAVLQHLAYLAALGGAGWVAVTLRTVSDRPDEATVRARSGTRRGAHAPRPPTSEAPGSP